MVESSNWWLKSMEGCIVKAEKSNKTPSSEQFPPDVVRLLAVLVRIERRRQARLRTLRMQEAS